MQDRRIIYDSEDEDVGLSPINSPSKGDVADPDLALGGERDTGRSPQQGLRASGVRSTDPEFFRKVYDEHQNVDTDLVPDSARDGNGNMGSSDRHKSSGRSARDNSSSLTDPTWKGARKNRNRADRVDLTNLTQVTTPRDDAQSGLCRDIYDFPSSDEEGDIAETTTARGQKKATETYGKRKRGQTVTPAKTAVSSSPAQSRPQDDSLILTHANECDEPSRPTRKKRKSGTKQSLSQVPEDVDLLVIPRTADMDALPANTRVGNENPGSIVPDSFGEWQSKVERPPASFFIAPLSRLTASQKQEFVQISGSSEHEREEHLETPLLAPQAVTQDQKFRSSQATIAYPTPSRYRTSAPQFPDPQETGDPGSSSTTASSRKSGYIARLGPTLPHSSPDELSSHSPNQTLLRTKRRRDNDGDDELAQDVSWDSENIGLSREQHVPGPSRRAGTSPDKHVREAAVAEADFGSAPKERVRTKQHVDVAQEDSWDSDNIGAHKEHYKPRPSRRRSRAVVQEDAEEDAPEQSMPDTCPPGGWESTEPIPTSSGQQAPQEEAEDIEGIDPEYLAALPEDIRQEVISNHLAQKSQAARTRGRSRPVQPLSALQLSPEEIPQPKKRGRKKKEPSSEQVMTAAQEAGTQATPASVAPVKKKRGRPRKSETVQLAPAPAADEDISLAYEAEDMAQAADDFTAEEAAAEPLQEAPMSAKAPPRRGRKRKAVAEMPTAPEEEPKKLVEEAVQAIEPVQALSATTNAPSRRGRKKQVVVEEPPTAPADEPQEDSDVPHDQSREVDRPAGLPDEPGESLEEAAAVPLQDISNTASLSGPSMSTKGKEEEGTPAKAKAKETPGPKSAPSTTGQGQGKVPLRVGLSKRLRIAPLLKVIRK